MRDNTFNHLEEVLKATRPVNVGFQHTEYAKLLFNIALDFKARNLLFRENVGRFHTALVAEADEYRKPYVHLLNHLTWDAWMGDLKKLLEPGMYPTKRKVLQ